MPEDPRREGVAASVAAPVVANRDTPGRSVAAPVVANRDTPRRSLAAGRGTPRESDLRLEESRRRAEERLAEVKEAVAGEVGRVPRNASLLLVGLAAAAGFALALRGRRRPAGRVANGDHRSRDRSRDRRSRRVLERRD